jgi:hypothetical protein
MAKRRPAKKTKRRARRKKSALAAPAAEGPVTLKEARALALPRQPRRAVARAVAPGAGPTPEPVGKARKQFAKERREERKRRKREYAATMKIMKRRGARAAGAVAAASFQPLEVVAEGDSWFDYPKFLAGGIIPRLEGRLGVPILNLADPGDEVREMLGVEQRERLIECLKEGSPAGGAWDVLLFSGGGNDIVGDPMALWIRDFDPAKTPAQLIDQPRFATAMALVSAGYEDLIGLRDEHSPGTHLVFHGYDFALPDGRGVCFLGPWLKPTFELRKFPEDIASSWRVVREMLLQFATMLTALTARPKVSFINGQGTLEPKRASWDNELHPEKAGFNAFADLFHAHLKGLFPNRVA